MFPESLLLVWNKINFEDNKSTISLGIKQPMNGLQQGIKMFGTGCGGKKYQTFSICAYIVSETLKNTKLKISTKYMDLSVWGQSGLRGSSRTTETPCLEKQTAQQMNTKTYYKIVRFPSTFKISWERGTENEFFSIRFALKVRAITGIMALLYTYMKCPSQ